MTQIFISHASVDLEFCQKLADSLAEVGVETFLDKEDIRPGEDWGESIQRGLDSCELMLLVVSPRAMKSRIVRLEWKYFFDRERTIIPILWKEADLPFELNPLQRIDFSEQNYDAAFKALHSELVKRKIPIKPIPSTPAPVQEPPPSFAPQVRVVTDLVLTVITAVFMVWAVLNWDKIKTLDWLPDQININKVYEGFGVEVPQIPVVFYTIADGEDSDIFSQQTDTKRQLRRTSEGGFVRAIPSPDGAYLALEAVPNEQGLQPLYLMEMKSGKLSQRLPDGYSIAANPVWSPDSRSLVYEASQGAGPALFLAYVDSPESQALEQGPEISYDADWSSDRIHIVFASSRDNGDTTGDSEIYLIRENGRDLTQLTFNAGNDYDPVLSPNGERVVFVSQTVSESVLMIMDIASPENVGLLVTSLDVPHQQSHPVWSPDGQKVAFMVASQAESEFGRLYIVDVESRETWLLYANANVEYAPCWLPSNQDLLFIGRPPSKNDTLFQISTDGAELKTIVSYPDRSVSFPTIILTDLVIATD